MGEQRLVELAINLMDLGCTDRDIFFAALLFSHYTREQEKEAWSKADQVYDYLCANCVSNKDK